MLGLALELKTMCGRCGQPVPVNAFAERVTCGSCQNAIALDTPRWLQLLESPIAELPELGADQGGNIRSLTGGESYDMMYGRQAPRCGGCKTTVADDALEFASRGWFACGGCGKRTSIRSAPPALAAIGAIAVVGEDLAQVNAAASAPAPQTATSAQPIVMYCPSCRAPLSIDGSTRLVKCTYCSTDVYLPDDLWQRLHPTATVARWYVWLRDVDVAAAKRARFHWDALSDVIADAHGNLYCAGEDGETDRFAVWCMGRDLAIRWVRDGLDYHRSESGITLDPGGRLLVWARGKHSATLLSAADGSVLGKLGGKQPEDATAHHFDLDDADAIEFDVDGTILALLNEHFVRFAPDGQPLPTWRPHGLFGGKEKMRPIYAPGHQRIPVEGVRAEDVGHYPHALDNYSHLCIGRDGRLYVNFSEWAACFDRTGRRQYRVKLPLDGQRGGRIAVDGAGRLYVVGYTQGDPQTRKVVRVSQDGGRVDVVATDRRAGGAVGSEELLVVAEDGTLLLFASYRRCRIIDPSGRLVHQTDDSRKTDAEEDEQAARRA
jgi:hypothetical protein